MADVSLSVFYVPCASEQEAEIISEKLLEEKLIACAQIFPNVRSLYVWEEKLEKARESILILKTTDQAKPQLLLRLRELHSYSCPCFLELEPRSINPDYAAWLIGQVPRVLPNQISEEKTKKQGDADPPPWD